MSDSPEGRVDVSVLIPVLDEERFIRDTVAAMRAQIYPGEVELIFVDGGSTDRTREILEELAGDDRRIRVLANPARRTPQGLNIGLRAARGEYVARMDAHSWYPPVYLARGVERLARGDVEWVTGPAIPRPLGGWSRRVGLALGSPLGQGGSSKWQATAGEVGEEIELDTGVFAGIWRRSTLERLGGWDEGWPVNQDAEMAARVLGAGGRIVCLPELGAEYAPRDTLRGLARQYWRFGYYRVKTTRRHPHALRRAHVLAPGVVLAAAAAVLAPRPVSALARVAIGAYAGALGVAAAREAPRAGRRDAAALPLVLATMHFSWGAGFIAACIRMGPPLAALARVAGVRGGGPAAAAAPDTPPG